MTSSLARRVNGRALVELVRCLPRVGATILLLSPQANTIIAVFVLEET